MVVILRRLVLFQKRWEFGCFFLLIVAAAAVLNETREIIFEGSNRLPMHHSLLRSAFTAVPLAACGTAILAYASRLRRELEALARTDQLTGLPNRRQFFETFEAAIAKGQQGVLLMTDVDHFKAVNDTYGHPVGDLCLKEFANVIRAHTRDMDFVARLGGEEFAVFLPHATMMQATIIAERLVNGIHLKLNDRSAAQVATIRATMSVGLSQTDGYSASADLIRQSDLALYAAKDQGRARMLVFGDHGGKAKADVPKKWPPRKTPLVTARPIAS